MSVRTIGAVGAGTMGAGITQVAAASGFQVSLIDVNEKALSGAMERIGSGFDRLVAKGQMTPGIRLVVINLIETGTDYATLAPADLVVEAATENADIKARIVHAVDKVVRAEAIISTTTSSFPSASLRHPSPIQCRCQPARDSFHRRSGFGRLHEASQRAILLLDVLRQRGDNSFK